MNDKTSPDSATLLSLTAQVVASFVGRNTTAPGDIPALVSTVYQSLSGIAAGGTYYATQRPDPAVPVRRSITPEYIVCLEDGKKLKMLKRHIKTVYGLTPEQYRERWGLPADYPLVAPNYAKQRSKLAKQIGLGTAKSRRKKQA